jgi:hypothetical protein
MAHFNATAVTAAPTLKMAQGLNVRQVGFSFAAGQCSTTASTTIAMCPIPGGSVIYDVELMARGDLNTNLNDGHAHLIAVRDSQAVGNLYITTATIGATLVRMTPAFNAFGRVVTSSANLYIWNQDATAGISVNFKLNVKYTSNLEASST